MIQKIQSATELADLLSVPRETVTPLEQYAEMLVKWQKAQNLVANGTLPDMWVRHFLDSAQLYPIVKERLGDGPHKLLDIGSGGGFPGLVLSAMGLVSAHMVDSNQRKCTFMSQVARSTGADAKAHAARIEELEPFDADIISSRACARLAQLLDWAAPFVAPNTHLYFLKGAGAEEELTEAESSWNMSVVRHKSLSDASGVILEITNLVRK